MFDHFYKNKKNSLNFGKKYESVVRVYSRQFPDVFIKGEGSFLYGVNGRTYLDFFTGAGALNYGHNHPFLKEALIQYVENNGVVHGLDMYTPAHLDFIFYFHEVILDPRKLNYKIQFTGPTGANAVEAAIKLARVNTKRKDIIYFTNAYHGLSLGALAVSDLDQHKNDLTIDFPHVIKFPYDHPQKTDEVLNQIQIYLDGLSEDKLPAAIILETIQAEGGVNVASAQWLQGIAALAAKWNVLLIIDEIQTGCGRTGPYFSFERFNLYPDIVCLSKSLSGYGLPLSMILMKPELDTWFPGEHSGTFRSNNLSLVCGIRALDFWRNTSFSLQVQENIAVLEQQLNLLVDHYPQHELQNKGYGLMRGLEWSSNKIANQMSKIAFENGLLVEPVGSHHQVLKIMPPLTATPQEIEQGINILECCLQKVVA